MNTQENFTIEVENASQARKVLEIFKKIATKLEDIHYGDVQFNQELAGMIADFESQIQAEEKLGIKTGRDYRAEVTEIFTELGMPSHLKGFRYGRDAIVFAAENFSLVDSVTKELYPMVAKVNGTTASRVERAIRHAVEVAWDRADPKILDKYFGNSVNPDKGKPTNSEFIAALADRLLIK